MCKLSIKEASKKYNVSERKIRYLISDTKSVPSEKVKNKRYIKEKDLNIFFERELLLSLEPLTRIKKIKYVGNQNYQFDVPKTWISFLKKNGLINNIFVKTKKNESIIYSITNENDTMKYSYSRLMFSSFNGYDRFRLFVGQEDLSFLKLVENDLIEISLNTKSSEGINITISKNPLEFKNFYSIKDLSDILNIKKHFLYLLVKNNFIDYTEINYEIMIPLEELGKLIEIIKKNFKN